MQPLRIDEVSDSVNGPAPGPTAVNLNEIRLDVADWDSDRLDADGRVVFESHCVEPARQRKLLTHDGEAVQVYRDRFDHACYSNASSGRFSYAKDEISSSRVARIPWIAPLIAGLVPNSECYWIREPRVRDKRLYVIPDDSYVVWLLLSDRGSYGWTFSSAYKATRYSVASYTKRQTRIWPTRGVG